MIVMAQRLTAPQSLMDWHPIHRLKQDKLIVLFKVLKMFFLDSEKEEMLRRRNYLFSLYH